MFLEHYYLVSPQKKNKQEPYANVRGTFYVCWEALCVL